MSHLILTTVLHNPNDGGKKILKSLNSIPSSLLEALHCLIWSVHTIQWRYFITPIFHIWKCKCRCYILQVKNPCFQSHVCSYRADTKGQAACLHLAAHIFYLEAPFKLESTQYSHRILLNTDFITVSLGWSRRYTFGKTSSCGCWSRVLWVRRL